MSDFMVFRLIDWQGGNPMIDYIPVREIGRMEYIHSLQSGDIIPTKLAWFMGYSVYNKTRQHTMAVYSIELENENGQNKAMWNLFF